MSIIFLNENASIFLDQNVSTFSFDQNVNKLPNGQIMIT